MMSDSIVITRRELGRTRHAAAPSWSKVAWCNGFLHPQPQTFAVGRWRPSRSLHRRSRLDLVTTASRPLEVPRTLISQAQGDRERRASLVISRTGFTDILQPDMLNEPTTIQQEGRRSRQRRPARRVRPAQRPAPPPTSVPSPLSRRLHVRFPHPSRHHSARRHAAHRGCPGGPPRPARRPRAPAGRGRARPVPAGQQPPR